MPRPDRVQMFMGVAMLVSRRSTCLRHKVGCVITDDKGTSVVSMGYNGNAAGQPDTCDTTIPGGCGCVHAETNALIKAPYHGVEDLVLYTTLSPCKACAKLILNSKIATVYVAEIYRDEEPLQMLDTALRARYRFGGVQVLPHFDIDRLLGREELRNEDSRIITAARRLVAAGGNPQPGSLLWDLTNAVNSSRWVTALDQTWER